MNWVYTYLIIGLLIAWPAVEIFKKAVPEGKHPGWANAIAGLVVMFIWPYFVVRVAIAFFKAAGGGDSQEKHAP